MGETTRSRSLEILGALVLLAAGPVGADSYNVDRFDDSTASGCSIYSADDCGLRGALIRANANPGDDIIRLDPGTYTLSIEGPGEDLCQTGDLDVTDTVLVKGKGPERTTIDAGGDAGVNDRVFDLHAPGKKLTLRGLTVTGGSPDTYDGGGIQVLDGSLRLETCVVSGNEILNGHSGSAIYALSADPAEVTEILDSWITGNTGVHGAVYLAVSRIERTTVSGNTSTTYGEGLSMAGDGSLLLDSTVSGHVGGGGLTIWGTGTEVAGCTLADNAGPAFGVASSGSATMSNTIVVGFCSPHVGQLTTLGGNLESPGDTCQFGAADLVGVADPGLSTLGFTGGPAPVYQPLAGSPALDASVAAANCSAADQRGLGRPRDGDGNGGAACDIGAVELAGPGELLVETFECGFTTGWSEAVR